jgi:hypothetical protein
VLLELSSWNAMRLSLAFAFIAGIMALGSLEVGVNRGPLLRRSTVRRFMFRPAVPGMMPSASLQLATQLLEKMPMLSRHGTSPLLAQAAFLKLRNRWSNFCRS